MNNNLKSAIKEILLGSLIAGSIIMIDSTKAESDRRIVEDWCVKNFLQIVKEEEQRLEINYDFNPRIRVSSKRPISDLGDSSSPSACYDPDNNTISFYSRNIDQDDKDRLKSILDHELGHAFMEQVRKRLGIKQDLEKHLKNRQIFEGIAEYFSKTMNPDYEPHKDGNCIFENNCVNYCKGYEIVKPTLDRLGINKGIEVLLQEAYKE